MYSGNSDYLTKLFEFSEEIQGIEMSFVDTNLENFYTVENYKRDLGKSTSFFIIVMFGYVLGLGMSIVMNKAMIRSSYIIIVSMLLEITFYTFTKYIKERYLFHKIMKNVRFLLIYLSIMLMIMFPVLKDKTQIIRNLYMFFAYTNLLFTYYVEFNYIIVVLVPLLNSFLIVFVNFYEEYDNYYLLPEFIFNLLVYYATFVIKKYEFLLNKKLFFEVFKNQQYINYIKQLIDVINTHVICINEKEVLFLNSLANKFFEKNVIPVDNNIYLNSRENLISNISLDKFTLRDQVFSFLKQLRINCVDSTIDSIISKGKSLHETIISFLADQDSNSNNFTRLGYFTDEKATNSFEIYARKLRFKQSVIEILLYDISEVKQAEQTKVETKYKKRILGKIAHEFKTPLITIISLINRILNFQQKDNLDQSITMNLNYIENLSNYTLSLIGDITQYVSDSINLKLFKKEINIKDTLEFSYNVLDTLIKCNENKVNRVQTKLVIKDGVDKIRVISDENRLKQILLNFVSNAYKFTINGFIKIKAKIRHEDQSVQISVKDSGFGIREDKQHLVFQEFTQFSRSNEYNSKGTGLGLSICKQISDTMKHKIGFVSKFGKGSKFYIRIGQYVMDESTEINNSLCFNRMKRMMSNTELINSDTLRSELQRKTEIDQFYLNDINYKEEIDGDVATITKRMNIFKGWDNDDKAIEIIEDNKVPLRQLSKMISYEEIESLKIKSSVVIVDDHQLLRENTINLIKSVLASLNMSSEYDIIEGSDGIELLNIIRLDKDNRIKYIFIDENMEYLNGSETVSIIRKLQQSQKIKKYFIVSITALDDEYYKNKILYSGVDKIIPKPCTKSDLKDIFSNLK